VADALEDAGRLILGGIVEGVLDAYESWQQDMAELRSQQG